MLFRSSSFRPENLPPPTPAENAADSPFQDYVHYTRFSLISRRDLFILACYKTENLEKFKGNIENAAIIARLLATLLQYYIPDIPNAYLVTTPKRAHTEKLGYHFASEICVRACQLINMEFIPDVLEATSKSKFNPNYIQRKPLPVNRRLVLFDDIATTYQTLYASLETLRSNPANNLQNVHVPIFIGINNN
jgi:hypothetical protein